MIRAVTFDLWYTIIRFDTERDRWLRGERAKRLQAIFRQAQLSGYEAAIEEYLAVKVQQLWEKTRAEGNYDLTAPEQVEYFLTELAVPEDARGALAGGVHEAFARTLVDWWPDLAPDFSAAVRALKAREIAVGLISNTGLTPGSTFREFFAAHGLEDVFDALVFSDEVRLLKPNPAIFTHAAEALDVSPTELAHVGDNPQADVAGVQAVGGKGILYQGFWADYHNPAEREKNEVLVASGRVVPDGIVQSHAELPALVSRWAG